MNRSNYIKEIMTIGEFPQAEIDAVLETYNAMLNNAEASEIFEAQVLLYENDVLPDFWAALQLIKKVAEIANVTKETILLAFIVCLTKHLRERYEKAGIEERFYFDVISDIKFKSLECYEVYGIYGTFVPEWFGRFFSMTRYALGRLQFETRYLPSDITINGTTIKKDTLTIAVHIPSGGPLDINECKKSFKLAYEKFLPLFPNGTVIFHCGSWLLAPDNKKLLPPTSNIVKFMDFFQIVPSDGDIEHDFWRIFGTMDFKDASKLPRNNTLQRVYAECAEKGEIPLAGNGIFFMKEGGIINNG